MVIVVTFALLRFGCWVLPLGVFSAAYVSLTVGTIHDSCCVSARLGLKFNFGL
jgi:hypothetical protein